jgi:copper chaperone NosL
MRLSLFFAALLAVTAVSGCGERPSSADAPPPREVTDASIGRYCGMALNEHPGPKGQVYVRGMSDPFWFSSVHDAVAFTMLPEEPKDIAAIYVNDMARAKNWDQPEPGTWIDAKKALFVIGSNLKGGMGSDEAIPFSDRSAADEFAARNGGRVVAFGDIPRSYVLSEGDATAASADPQGSARAAETEHAGHSGAGAPHGGHPAGAAHGGHRE